MSVYRSIVRSRIEARERGLSAASLSRLTRSADDQRAWDEAYIAALLLGVGRELEERRDRRAASVASFWSRFPSAASVMERDA